MAELGSKDDKSALYELTIRPKVFVSYSRKDAAFAEALVADLTQDGFEAYLDTKEIAPGEPWQERLAALIVKADAIAFVLSPDSIDPKSVCDWELNEAERLSKRIIPVVCRQVSDSDVPGRLKRLNYVFLTPEHNRASEMAKLVDGLKVDIRWIRQHTDIGEASERWSHPEKGGDHVLLQGKAINDAELWISSRPAEAPQPTNVQRAFIKASREAEIARAEKERRHINRTRRFQRMVGVLLVIGLAGIIWQDIETTKREQVVFTSKATDAAAIGQHDRALRLALQSYPADGALWWTPQATSLTDLLTGSAVASRLIEERARATQQTVNAEKSGWWVTLEDKDRGAINLWHTQTNEIVLGRARDLARFSSRAISQDHRYELLLDITDATAHVREFSTGKLVSTLAKFGALHIGAFSSDGEKVLITGENNSAGLYNTASGIRIGAQLVHDEFVEALAISPDGKVAATADGRGTIRVWNATDGSIIHNYIVEGAPTALAFSPDGRVLAVGDQNGGVSLWGVVTAGKFGDLEGHRDRIWSISFSSYGDRLATSSSDQSVIIWDAAASSALLTLRVDHHEAVFGGDGQKLLTRSKQSLRVWDVANKLSQAEEATAWVPDGRQSKVAVIERADLKDPFLTLADIEGFKVLGRKKLECHSEAVAHWSFNRAGDRLLSVSKDKTACIWAVADGKLLHKLGGHERGLTHGTFSADGRYVATAAEDGTARVYDAESGANVAVLRDHSSLVSWVDFSPDGKGLVTTSYDSTAKVWNLRGQKTNELKLDDLGGAAVFSPTGGEVAVQTLDGEIILWNVAKGIKLASLRGVGNQAQTTTFSVDGKQLRSTTFKHEHVWDLAWLTLAGPDLRRRVCAERLVGAQSFTDDELRDPILSGIDRNVDEARSPCLRRGPLHWAYYTQAVTRWSRWWPR